MFLKSPAKINLALDVLKKDPSGYHQIQTVFYEVPDFYDAIEIIDQPRDITIICDQPAVPTDETNTVYQAVKLLQNFSGLNRGLKIKLKKNIPPGSGLGGGSSNAATVLKALNKSWKLNLSESELIKLAAKIGLDVPFFILGGTALGEHYGEQITPLPNINLPIKIIVPDIKISTKSAYENLDLKTCAKNIAKTKLLIDALKIGDQKSVIENVHNDFEDSIFKNYPVINQTKQKLLNEGYKKVFLSGSGSGVFYFSKQIVDRVR